MLVCLNDQNFLTGEETIPKRSVPSLAIAHDCGGRAHAEYHASGNQSFSDRIGGVDRELL
jgi:hypothetical protein